MKDTNTFSGKTRYLLLEWHTANTEIGKLSNY